MVRGAVYVVRKPANVRFQRVLRHGVVIRRFRWNKKRAFGFWRAECVLVVLLQFTLARGGEDSEKGTGSVK